MNSIVKKFAIASTSIALFGAGITPAFAADTNVTVTNTGIGSHTSVGVTSTNSQTTSQTNNTSNFNVVGQKANTGKNKIGFTVGGSNSIATGATTQTATVTNNGNSNTATNNCGCAGGNTNVTVNGSGLFSWTSVGVTNTNTKTTTQTNNTSNVNIVGQSANTGKNGIGFTVGGNDSINTGAATQTTTVTNSGGTNTSL